MFSVSYLDYHDNDAREKNNDFLIEHVSISAVFSIEVLMEEFELVVAGNYRFENRAEEKKHFLENLGCHGSDAWIKTKSLLIDSSCANRKCLMDTLVGQIIPVPTEKYYLDYGNKSIILNIF